MLLFHCFSVYRSAFSSDVKFLNLLIDKKANKSMDGAKQENHIFIFILGRFARD